MFRKNATGFIPDEIDNRDANYERIFGVGISKPNPTGRVDRIKNSPLNKNVLYQDGIPSCVCCSVAWINMYNSYFNDGNKIIHSWPFLFAKTPHLEKGRRVRDVLQLARTEGVSQDIYFSQMNYKKGRAWVENPTNISNDAYVDAKNYKINNFSYIYSKDGLYEAIQKQPVLIAMPGNNKDWKKDLITYENGTEWHHMVVAVDVDSMGNIYIVNWWKKKLDIRKIHKDYPLTVMASMQDLPDGWQAKSYEGKLLKAKNKPDVFKIHNDKRYLVSSEEAYKVCFDDWDKVIELEKEVLEVIPKADKKIKLTK